MLGLFQIAIDMKTGEVVFSGNIAPEAALQITQNIVISEAIRKAKDGEKNATATVPKMPQSQ